MSQDEHFDSEILSYFEPLQKLVKQLQAKRSPRWRAS